MLYTSTTRNRPSSQANGSLGQVARLKLSSKATFLARVVADWILGFDIFVSYSWSDGRAYAEKLTEDLSRTGFSVFLDDQGMNAGLELETSVEIALRRSRMLVVIASAKALDSRHVAHEIRTFEKLGRDIVPIVPFILAQEMRKVVPEQTAPTLNPHKDDQVYLRELILSVLRRRIWLEEEEIDEQSAPSPNVVSKIKNSIRGLRRNRLRMAFAIGLIIVLALLATFSAVQTQVARWQTTVTELQRDAARAQAESVRSPRSGLVIARETMERASKQYSPDPPPNQFRAVLVEALERSRELPILRGWGDGLYPGVEEISPDPSGSGRMIITTTALVVVADALGRPVAPPIAALDLRPSFANSGRWGRREGQDVVLVASGAALGETAELTNVGVSIHSLSGDMLGMALSAHQTPITAIVQVSELTEAEGLPRQSDLVLAGDSAGNLFAIDLANFSHRLVLPGAGRAITDLSVSGEFSQTLIVAFGDIVETRRSNFEPGDLQQSRPSTPAAAAARLAEQLSVSNLSVGFAGWQPGDGVACILPLRHAYGSTYDSFLFCNEDGAPHLVPSFLHDDSAGDFGAGGFPIGTGSGTTAAASCAAVGVFAVGDRSGEVRLWSTNEESLTLPLPNDREGAVTALAFDETCEVLLAAYENGSAIRRWDVGDVGGDTIVLRAESGSVEGVAVDTSGHSALLVTRPFDGQRRIDLYALNSEIPDVVVYSHPIDLDFDPILARENAAWIDEGRVHLLQARTGGEIRVLPTDGSTLYAAFSSNGNSIAVITVVDGQAFLQRYSVETLELLSEFELGDKYGFTGLFPIAGGEVEFAAVDVHSQIWIFDTGGRLLSRSDPLSVSVMVDPSESAEAAKVGFGSPLSEAQEYLAPSVTAVVWEPVRERVLVAASAETFTATTERFDSVVYSVDPTGSENAEVTLNSRGRIVSMALNGLGELALVTQSGSNFGTSRDSYRLRLVSLSENRIVRDWSFPFDDDAFGMEPIVASWFDGNLRLNVALSSGRIRQWKLSTDSLLMSASLRLAAWQENERYEATLALAQAARDRGDAEEGRALSRQAGEMRPDVAMPWMTLGNMICNRPQQSGDCAAAERAFSQAIAAVPHAPFSHLLRGKVRFFQGNFAGALEDFEAVSRLVIPIPPLELGRTSLPSLSSLAETIQQLQNGMRYEPLFFRAQSLSNLKQFPEASDAYTDIIDRFGGSIVVYEYRGRAYLETGRYQEALADVETALEMLRDPNRPYSRQEGFEDYYRSPRDRAMLACDLVWNGVMLAGTSIGLEDQQYWADRITTHCSAAYRIDPVENARARDRLVKLSRRASEVGIDVKVEEVLLLTVAEHWDRISTAGDIAAIEAFRETYSGYPEAALAGYALAGSNVSSDLLGTGEYAGTWATDSGSVRYHILQTEGGAYEWRNADADRPFVELGEVIMRTRENNLPWPQRGQLLWVGEDMRTWSEDDIWVARIVDPSHLFVANLGSTYKGGWLLVRVE